MIVNQKKSRQQLRAEKRQEIKNQSLLEKVEKAAKEHINNLLNSAFSEEQLNNMAEEAGLILRERELTAFSIVAVLTLGCSSCNEISSLETICRYLENYFNITMKPQSLQSRINQKEMVTFIKNVTVHVMKHEANKIFSKIIKKQFKKNGKLNHKLFNRILIQDSTVISLPETLSRIYRGCGGAGSSAAVKCDVIIDLTNHVIIRMKCIAGRIPDASLSSDIEEYTEKGDLIIRDLGYFNLSQFDRMIQKGIEFISRLSKSTHVYLTEKDENPLNLIEYLEKLGIQSKGIDITIYVGKKDRIPMRIIGVKVPEEVKEQRIARFKKNRKTEPSEELQEWNGYTLMITNISKDKLSYKKILKLYKSRWQIELFFKNMKSHLCVDKLSGKNKNRIQVLVFIKLMLTWIHNLLYAYAQMLAPKDKEISLFKFTKWLKEKVNWIQILITMDISNLLESLRQDVFFLLKKSIKRKRLRVDCMKEIGLEREAA